MTLLCYKFTIILRTFDLSRINQLRLLKNETLLLLKINTGCFNLLSKGQKEIRKNLAKETEEIDGKMVVYF